MSARFTAASTGQSNFCDLLETVCSPFASSSTRDLRYTTASALQSDLQGPAFPSSNIMYSQALTHTRTKVWLDHSAAKPAVCRPSHLATRKYAHDIAATSSTCWRLQSLQRQVATCAVAGGRQASKYCISDPNPSNGDEVAAKKAAMNITVFSAAPYVESFLTGPLQNAGFTNLCFTQATLDKDTAALAQDAEVVCLFVNDNCDAKVVAKLAECGVKLIAMRCAGYDRVDLAACAEHEIKVVRVPTYSPTSVAEHAVSLLMALNRKLHQAYVRVQAGNYSLSPLIGVELRHKTVCILGTGAIGAETARICQGIGMDVIAYDVRKNPAVESLGIPYMSLEEALPQADVVSLHVPLLKATHHIINTERINMMKQGAILLNVSRGGLVDSEALMAGLEHAQLGAVGMDVYENEGELFFTDWTDLDIGARMRKWDRRFKVLTSYPQVLITPHSAFLTYEALANIASTTISNIDEYLTGKDLTNALKP